MSHVVHKVTHAIGEYTLAGQATKAVLHPSGVKGQVTGTVGDVLGMKAPTGPGPAPVTPTPEQEQVNQNQANLEAQRAAAAGRSNTILTSGLGITGGVSRKKKLGA